MDVIAADVVIIGAGGAGLRAAIAVAESRSVAEPVPDLEGLSRCAVTRWPPKAARLA